MTDDRDRAIRKRAYRLWEEGGRQDGSEERDWLAAEASLAGEAPPPADAGVQPTTPDSAAISPAPAIVSPPEPQAEAPVESKKPGSAGKSAAKDDKGGKKSGKSGSAKPKSR